MSLPDFEAKVKLEASVSPSEDPEKVAAALGNIVGMASADATLGPRSARLVTADKRALVRVRDQLRDRHVRSAARRRMLLNKARGSTTLMLNRQAAAAGVIAICGSPEESPLGPVYLTLLTDRLDAAIDWLTAYEGG